MISVPLSCTARELLFADFSHKFDCVCVPLSKSAQFSRFLVMLTPFLNTVCPCGFAESPLCLCALIGAVISISFADLFNWIPV